METIEAGIPQYNEGAGTGAHEIHNEACGCWPPPEPTPVTFTDTPAPGKPSPKFYSEGPAPLVAEKQELAPNEPITPKMLRELRGKYFTVRHILLTDCGHNMDVINEPRHRNCENCWWQWLNFHPQLVKSVDEAWQEHGKAFVIRLRGRHFAKMFGRYMASVRHFMEQEEKAKQACEILSTMGKEQDGNDRQAAGTEGGGKEIFGAVTTTDQSGEDQGSSSGREVAQ